MLTQQTARKQQHIRKMQRKRAERQEVHAMNEATNKRAQLTKKVIDTSLPYSERLAAVYQRYNEHLRENAEMVRRLGMTERRLPEFPADVNDPVVKKRIDHVLETNNRVPSIDDLLTDFDLGNEVRMLTRNSMNHEGLVCSARNRIWLRGRQVEDAEKLLEKSLGLLDELRMSIEDKQEHADTSERIQEIRNGLVNLRAMEPVINEADD